MFFFNELFVLFLYSEVNLSLMATKYSPLYVEYNLFIYVSMAYHSLLCRLKFQSISLMKLDFFMTENSSYERSSIS